MQILEEARQAEQSVSRVCRRHQTAPGQFYLRERQAREGGVVQALRNGKRERKKADPAVPLQAEIERLRTVVAGLSAENLQLKKGLWPQVSGVTRRRRRP